MVWDSRARSRPSRTLRGREGGAAPPTHAPSLARALVPSLPLVIGADAQACTCASSPRVRSHLLRARAPSPTARRGLVARGAAEHSRAGSARRVPPPLAIATESKNMSSKQRAAIDKLKSDNMALKDELAMENRYSALPTNPAATAQITKLQDQADMFTRKVRRAAAGQRERERERERKRERLSRVPARTRAMRPQRSCERNSPCAGQCPRPTLLCPALAAPCVTRRLCAHAACARARVGQQTDRAGEAPGGRAGPADRAHAGAHRRAAQEDGRRQRCA